MHALTVWPPNENAFMIPVGSLGHFLKHCWEKVWKQTLLPGLLTAWSQTVPTTIIEHPNSFSPSFANEIQFRNVFDIFLLTLPSGTDFSTHQTVRRLHYERPNGSTTNKMKISCMDRNIYRDTETNLDLQHCTICPPQSKWVCGYSKCLCSS